MERGTASGQSGPPAERSRSRWAARPVSRDRGPAASSGKFEDAAPRVIALATPGQTEAGRAITAFAPWLLGGRRLYCLDGGNVFNPYRLAAWARREGHDAAILLDRVFVSRAYTCHQLLGSLERLVAPLAALAQPPPVVILGVDHLFIDEDLPLWERRYLFTRILEEAQRLRAEGVPMLLTFVGEGREGIQGSEGNKGRKGRGNPWIEQLNRAALVLPDASKALRQIEEPKNPEDQRSSS